MKDLTLEDMTKPELIKIITQSFAYQPTQNRMRLVRWESVCEASQKLMTESIEEQKEWAGKPEVHNHAEWLKASEKFDEGMRLGSKADAFLQEINKDSA